MPFPMKIQPIDESSETDEPVKPVLKSRFKRLFERQLTSVLRISAGDKSSGEEQQNQNKDATGASEFEPSTMCLAKMVQNFMEDGNEKQKCGKNRCNCFNGNCSDMSEDEFEVSSSKDSVDACEILKSLVVCQSVVERNLLADTSKIVGKNKNCSKRKDDCRKIVANGLISLGYDASICKSRWEKAPTYPSGEYEYVDVNVEGERLIIDVDFRSEFEIARSTKTYKSVLQILPVIFVGKTDRLQKIVSVVSEAAKQSLKKKGMPFPPWRKAEYVNAKWLSPYTRAIMPIEPVSVSANSAINSHEGEPTVKLEKMEKKKRESSSSGEIGLIFGEKISGVDDYVSESSAEEDDDGEKRRLFLG
ncbi:Protein of unknown function PDDEXK-like [Dillenia turbinata]|uniref:Uncharacterized protein n=1 Tax=Dillenia turbinata TaxID=194707 RepID=A0AAN8ZEC3_9MAGN